MMMPSETDSRLGVTDDGVRVSRFDKDLLNYGII